MIVGGYTLHLYCDNENEDDHHRFSVDGNYYFYVNGIEISFEFVEETFSGCVRQARKAGWLVNRKTNKCLCPVCNKKMKVD